MSDIEIDFGERRSVPELFPDQVCGCGCKVRYISVRGDHEGSCNQYGRCPSWEKLREQNEQLRDTIRLIEQALRIDSAEYVPAIRDVFTIIDETTTPAPPESKGE